jgi:hypothetical protein
MAYLFFFLGALIPTFLVSRLILLILIKWNGSYLKYIVGNFIALAIVTVLAGYGMAEGPNILERDPVLLKALFMYGPPQCACIIFDLIRSYRRSSKPTVKKDNET